MVRQNVPLKGRADSLFRLLLGYSQFCLDFIGNIFGHASFKCYRTFVENIYVITLNTNFFYCIHQLFLYGGNHSLLLLFNIGAQTILGFAALFLGMTVGKHW